MERVPRGRGDGQEEMGGDASAAVVVDMNSPNAKEIVESLVAMGIGRSDAELAVRQTGADSAEIAINWVFENQNREDALNVSQARDLYLDYKMVFVVDASLQMSPGKMAAQVAHGAVSLYQDLISDQEEYGGPLLQWNENGCRKIVVRCESAQEMNQLVEKAQQAGLPFSTVEDMGLTEIPAGSRTVMAVFGVVSEVDKITGHLRLF